ncbi:hypothetical protein ACLOJK_007787 [Asimina triloba]
MAGHAVGRDAAGELLTVGFAGLLLAVDQVGPMELVADGDVARFVAVGEEMGNAAGRLDLGSMRTIDAAGLGISGCWPCCSLSSCSSPMGCCWRADGAGLLADGARRTLLPLLLLLLAGEDEDALLLVEMRSRWIWRRLIIVDLLDGSNPPSGVLPMMVSPAVMTRMMAHCLDCANAVGVVRPRQICGRGNVVDLFVGADCPICCSSETHMAAVPDEGDGAPNWCSRSAL